MSPPKRPPGLTPRFVPVAGDPQRRTGRREFLKSGFAKLGLAALAATGAGAWVWKKADDITTFEFDLEKEIREGTLYQVHSKVFDTDDDSQYEKLKEYIDKNETFQLAQYLHDKGSEISKAVIAKSLAYLASKEPPEKEGMIKAILEEVPFTRDKLLFITLTRRADGSIITKPLPELVRDGYTVDLGPAQGFSGDPILSNRLTGYIQQLSTPGYGQSP